MVTIIKANGEKQEFSEEKLNQSIKRAGIPQDIQEKVLAHVRSTVHEGMHTSELYGHIAEFLEHTEKGYHKAKYSLKQALMDIGPTGYPFEDYVAKILMQQGYKATVRNTILGKCISHEIDVIATKDTQKIMVEAKYHNSVGIKTDVHVALYTFARFEDVKEKGNFTKPLLITNTKITTDATSYAECVGMDVVSWDFPNGNSLRDLVEKYHMYPITSLSKLPSTLKQELLQQGIVLCKDICLNPTYIESLHLPQEDKQQILAEAKFLCNQA